MDKKDRYSNLGILASTRKLNGKGISELVFLSRFMNNANAAFFWKIIRQNNVFITIDRVTSFLLT